VYWLGIVFIPWTIPVCLPKYFSRGKKRQTDEWHHQEEGRNGMNCWHQSKRLWQFEKWRDVEEGIPKLDWLTMQRLFAAVQESRDIWSNAKGSWPTEDEVPWSDG
jgi:hypothetical protein